MLVTSVRYDVIEATYDNRAARGRVWIFDPAGVVPQGRWPNVLGWNPLEGIDSWDTALARAGGFCEGADMKDVREGSFWLTKARQMLAPLFYAAAIDPDCNFSDVVRWLSMERGAMQRAVDDVLDYAFGHSENENDEAARQTLLGITKSAENTFSGVASTASSVLSTFDYLKVQSRADIGGVSIEEFLDGDENTLYVCAPAVQQRQYKPIFTALVREVVNRVYEKNSSLSDDLKIPFLLCLDEAGNVAQLEDLDTIATTAAGTDIQLISIFHDLSQMSAAYGPTRSSLIVNNHSATLCLPGNRDPLTSGLLSAQLSDQEVRGLDHFGWNGGDLRKLLDGEVVCLYENVPGVILKQRRYYEEGFQADSAT